MASYPPDYYTADLLHWRDGCIDETKLVAQYLDHWKHCHQKLDWIGYLRPGEPVLYYADEDPSESEVRRSLSASALQSSGLQRESSPLLEISLRTLY